MKPSLSRLRCALLTSARQVCEATSKLHCRYEHSPNMRVAVADSSHRSAPQPPFSQSPYTLTIDSTQYAQIRRLRQSKCFCSSSISRVTTISRNSRPSHAVSSDATYLRIFLKRLEVAGIRFGDPRPGNMESLIVMRPESTCKGLPHLCMWAQSESVKESA
jgi:hypothetical protein